MSKMSQLAMELDEQAVELGFKDREDAMQNGYEVISDGTFARLVETETEQEKAHNAWLDQRDQIITNLTTIKEKLETEGYDIYTSWLEETINFIKQGEI